MAKQYPWVMDEYAEAHGPGEAKHKLPKYPADHKLGMAVPEGGSNCAKCEYVRAKGKECANKYFQKWNGSNVLPEPADEYCCDFFEAK